MEFTYQLRADIAVIGILRRLRDAGPGLASLQQLRDEWPRYGLRRSDLDRAVGRLESAGFVTVERLKGLQWLGLTHRGDRWAHALRTWLNWALMLPRRIHLWFHGVVESTGSEPTRRRLVDRLGRALDG